MHFPTQKCCFSYRNNGIQNGHGYPQGVPMSMHYADTVWSAVRPYLRSCKTSRYRKSRKFALYKQRLPIHQSRHSQLALTKRVITELTALRIIIINNNLIYNIHNIIFIIINYYYKLLLLLLLLLLLSTFLTSQQFSWF